MSHPQYHADTQTRSPPTTVYTDPVTQGYNSVFNIPQRQVACGKIGDPAKFAARLYDMVMGAGLGESQAGDDASKRVFNKMPFGSDCGERIISRLETTAQNIRALESVWSSTDVEPERLHLFSG